MELPTSPSSREGPEADEERLEEEGLLRIAGQGLGHLRDQSHGVRGRLGMDAGAGSPPMACAVIRSR